MQFYILVYLLLLQLAFLNQFTFAVKRLSIHYLDKENQGPSKAKYNVKPPTFEILTGNQGAKTPSNSKKSDAHKLDKQRPNSTTIQATHITTQATTHDPFSPESHKPTKEIQTTSHDLKEETSPTTPVQDVDNDKSEGTTSAIEDSGSSENSDSDSTSEANQPTSDAKEPDSETKEPSSEAKEPASSEPEVNIDQQNDRDTDRPGHLGSLCTDRGDCDASKFLDCSRELEGQSMPKDGRLNQTIIDANMKHQHSGTCVCMMGLRNFEGIECEIEYNEPCETGMVEKLTMMGYNVASSPKCYQSDCTPINNGHFCRSHHEAGAMFISQEKLDEL